MTDLRQRVEPIRSKAIRDAAKGQRCTIQIPGICNHDPETVVLCHVIDDQYGRGRKADDTSAFFGCYACHCAYDQHRTGLEEAAELRLVLRAVQRTLRRLIVMGIVVVPEDAPRRHSLKATKPRKSREQRKAIPSRADPWPEGRSIPSRQFQKREKATI